MATLYYNAAVNTNWNTLGNWWQDSIFTIPAASTPTTGDTVYIEGNVSTGPSSTFNLADLYVAQINNSVSINNAGTGGISATGNLTVGHNTYLTGYINAALSIGGAATFYGSSYNSSTLTLTGGTANFYTSSSNNFSGTINGSAIFNDSSHNYHIVTGDATFNDGSVNSSTVGGNATFNNHSSNSGTVSGNASVYYPVTRPLGGTVTGTTSYLGYPGFYFNAAVDGTWDNVSNWWQDEAFSIPAASIPTSKSTVFIEADLTTGPSSAIYLGNLYIAQVNSGTKLADSGAGITVTGNLYVGSGASTYGRIESATLHISGNANFYGNNGGNSGNLTVGTATFYNSTSNYGITQGSTSNGTITGVSYFRNSSINYCSVAALAFFYDSAVNASGATTAGSNTSFYNSSYNASGASVTGVNAFFNDASHNAGAVTVTASAYFSSTAYNASGATVAGSASFANNSYNASGATVTGTTTFDNYSYNASGAIVTGSTTFKGSSSNSGLITGNASAYSPVLRPLGGTITGTITYIGYPAARTVYFNGGADGSWDNFSNWWLDNYFSISTSPPMYGDTAYIEGTVTMGPSSPIILNDLYIAQINNGSNLASSGAGISTIGNMVVGSGVYTYGRIEAASVTVGGAASFYGGGGGNSGTITVGTANFYLGTSNYGTDQGSSSNGVITGNAIFHDKAKNYCSVTGTAIFSETSTNDLGGAITSDSAFIDSSGNTSGGTVGGNGTFRNNTFNSGLISGDATVYYPTPRPIGGTVTGLIAYINYP